MGENEQFWNLCCFFSAHYYFESNLNIVSNSFKIRWGFWQHHYIYGLFEHSWWIMHHTDCYVDFSTHSYSESATYIMWIFLRHWSGSEFIDIFEHLWWVMHHTENSVDFPTQLLWKCYIYCVRIFKFVVFLICFFRISSESCTKYWLSFSLLLGKCFRNIVHSASLI